MPREITQTQPNILFNLCWKSLKHNQTPSSTFAGNACIQEYLRFRKDNVSGGNQTTRANLETFNLNHTMLIQRGTRESGRKDMIKSGRLSAKLLNPPAPLRSTS
jgi:hypothetical protein